MFRTFTIKISTVPCNNKTTNVSLFQDKLLLEPYGKPRDVVYVVVSPDSDYVLTHVKRFFKELSTVYELSRLGKHSPMSKVLRDGIMRVGKKAQNLGKEQVEDWFLNIGKINWLSDPV